MKRLIAIYRSKDKAMEAVRELKEHEFKAEQLSVEEEGEAPENRHAKWGKYPNAPILIAMPLFTLIGLMVGTGTINLPSIFYQLNDAGAMIGALAGFDFGVVLGGAISIYLTVAYPQEEALKAEQAEKEHHFDVFVDGDDKDVAKARQFLHLEGASWMV